MHELAFEVELEWSGSGREGAGRIVTDDLVLRVRATSHWAVQPGGCADSTDDGWTLLHGLPTGSVTLTQSLAGTPCPG